MNGHHLPLSQYETLLANEMFDIAFKIHRAIGPGLLESIYEKCFCYELNLREIPFKKQYCTPLIYESLLIENALKIDLLVDDLIIIELKAQINYNKIWEAQLLSYLKMSEKRIGFIFNFHSALLKDGIKRFIL